MVEGNDGTDVKNMNTEQLALSMFKELQASQNKIEELNSELKKTAEAAKDGKVDEKLLKELEEAKKKSEEYSKVSEEYQKVQELMKQKEKELEDTKNKSMSTEEELKKFKELSEVQKAQYNSVLEKIEKFEKDRQSELENKKRSQLSSFVDKYVELGLIQNNPEDKQKKLDELMNLSDSSVNELSAIIDRKFENTPSRKTKSSQELQLDAAESIRNDNEKTKEQKLDELFKIMQK